MDLFKGAYGRECTDLFSPAQMISIDYQVTDMPNKAIKVSQLEQISKRHLYMKLFFIFLSIIIFFTQTSPLLSLTLKELTDKVIANSALLESFQYKIKSDKYSYKHDKSQLLPYFTLPLDSGYDTTVGGWQFSPGLNAYLDLQKILTHSPALSELKVERSRIEGQMAKSDLEKEIMLAYYRLYVLAQQRIEDTSMKAYFDTHLQNLQKMADKGVDLSLDILRVKNQRASLSLSMDNSYNEMENILTSISSLSGINLSMDDFTFKDIPLLKDETSQIDNYEENIPKSAENTYQSDLNKIDLKMSEKSADQNRLYWIPLLQFYSGLQITNSNRPDYKFGIGLEFPLFDFGQRENQLQSSINAYNSQKSLYKDNHRKLSLYLRQLVENAEKSYILYKNSLENLDNAKKSMSAANILYQKGKITETDLLSVSLDWSNSKKQYYESLYNYLSNKSEITYFLKPENKK